jgi:hypothetical protein
MKSQFTGMALAAMLVAAVASLPGHAEDAGLSPARTSPPRLLEPDSVVLLLSFQIQF